MSLIPFNRVVTVVVATMVAPYVLKKMKPVTKVVGDAVVTVGEGLRKFAEEPDPPKAGTEDVVQPPNADVKRDETTKSGTTAGGVPVTSASPTGQEELEQVSSAEIKGDTEVPDIKDPQPSKPRPKRKKVEPDQPLNPKRTGNSRPD